MVNELLIQMQSFDQPPFGRRLKAKIKSWINGYLPPAWQMTPMRSEYSNILLIAATNRGDSLDPALLRPGRFDRRLYFDVPTKQERRDLIDFFLGRKAHDEELGSDEGRDRIATETFAYTPVMIEHLFDEALLVALRDGRREMRLRDVMDAKFDEEVGLKQTTVYTDFDREAVATHEAGHATIAYFVGTGRRLEVLSIIKRRGSLGLLAHSDEEERLTRTRSEMENGIAIALGGLAAEELCLGESGTGPGADLAHATQLAAQMVGSFGMAGSLISYAPVAVQPRRQGAREPRDEAAGGGHPQRPARARRRGAGREPRRARGARRRATRARRARPRRDPRGHREGPRQPAVAAGSTRRRRRLAS
jgi:hypothetical protein